MLLKVDLFFLILSKKVSDPVDHHWIDAFSLSYLLIQSSGLISISQVQYHLYCQQYPDISGANENRPVFFLILSKQVSHPVDSHWIHTIWLSCWWIQCSAWIPISQVQYHLYCQQYLDTSGANENRPVFSKFYPNKFQILSILIGLMYFHLVIC